MSIRPFNWICPFCNHASVINDARFSREIHHFANGNKHGGQAVITTAIVCANPECEEFALSCALFSYEFKNQRYVYGEDALKEWSLIPASSARPFPEYVPQVIRDDYSEACAIRDLSPKASATLSRRCLQGMIRDFWTVKPGRLFDEIEAIREKVDPESWDAIDGVRSIGNIGAHMEADINLIVDVDPDEAGLLIQLIETLISEWYVARRQRQERMSGVKALAAAKREAKKAGP